MTSNAVMKVFQKLPENMYIPSARASERTGIPINEWVIPR